MLNEPLNAPTPTPNTNAPLPVSRPNPDAKKTSPSRV